jgi:hypothetical protein
MQNETGRDLIATDVEADAQAPTWQHHAQDARPIIPSAPKPGFPLSAKALQADERLTRYRETRSYLDVLLHTVREANGPISAAVLRVLQNTHDTLNALRTEIKQGKKTPAVRTFLENWETLPGSEYVVDLAVAAAKAQKDKLRAAKGAAAVGQMCAVDKALYLARQARAAALMAIMEGPPAGEQMNVCTETLRQLSVAEAIAAVNALRPHAKFAHQPTFPDVLIAEAKRLLPPVDRFGVTRQEDSVRTLSGVEVGQGDGDGGPAVEPETPELAAWREVAFSHLTVPKGTRGELTILILRQVSLASAWAR